VVTYDIVIVGGSLGGCAAALAAGGGRFSVCLLEASGWLGGQYSAQGVTKPDESRYTPTVGSTAAYRAFHHNVRAFYRNNYQLSSQGQNQPTLNPGGAYPGFSTEPLVAHQILLQELQAMSNVNVRLNTRVTGANVQGDTIKSLETVDGNGNPATYNGTYFLDATDLGDLLPLAGVEFSLGAESKAQTGEPNAPDTAQPNWIQPITVVVALERRPQNEDNTIAKPANYDQLKASQQYTQKDGYISKVFQTPVDLWTYRRYIAAGNFNDPAFPNDLSMLNMAANDYQGATIPTGDATKDAQIVANARAASLGFVYWLQTECPRDDGSGNGYPNLRVRPDQFNTSDGTAAQPYIRESRRIKAKYTVVQQDLDSDYNSGLRAKNYRDSCGIGLYGGLDIHGLAAVGMDEQFINIKPFEIPASALIPVRVQNLLAACKNLGVTHITNGAYRLHPIEWNVGEAAGALALYALDQNVVAAGVPANAGQLRAYQQRLLDRGVPLFWWTDITFGDPSYAAAHLMGAMGLMSGDGVTMDFDTNDAFGDAAKGAIESKLGRSLNWPAGDMTRGQAAQWLLTQV
jgi:hypothetical protein